MQAIAPVSNLVWNGVWQMTSCFVADVAGNWAVIDITKLGDKSAANSPLAQGQFAVDGPSAFGSVMAAFPHNAPPTTEATKVEEPQQSASTFTELRRALGLLSDAEESAGAAASTSVADPVDSTLVILQATSSSSCALQVRSFVVASDGTVTPSPSSTWACVLAEGFPEGVTISMTALEVGDGQSSSLLWLTR